MTTDRISATFALAFAAFITVAELVRNWGAWGLWPFWLVDYIAAALLFWAWWSARRRRPGAHAVLTGAWGFACGMFYISFFSHLYGLGSTGGPVPSHVLTWVAGVLFAVTVVAFASAIAVRPRRAEEP